VRGAHRGLVGHVEGVEGAFEVFVVLILVRLAVVDGEQRLGQEELLDLGPRGVYFFAALELDAVRDFDGGHGGDVVEPLDGLAGIGVDAVAAILEALELVECLR
jgi:hypothetical protein